MQSCMNTSVLSSVPLTQGLPKLLSIPASQLLKTHLQVFTSFVTLKVSESSKNPCLKGYLIPVPQRFPEFCQVRLCDISLKDLRYGMIWLWLKRIDRLTSNFQVVAWCLDILSLILKPTSYLWVHWYQWLKDTMSTPRQKSEPSSEKVNRVVKRLVSNMGLKMRDLTIFLHV